MIDTLGFIILQAPVIPLPTVTELEMTGIIGQFMAWAPIEFMATALPSITVLGVILRWLIRALM